MLEWQKLNETMVKVEGPDRLDTVVDRAIRSAWLDLADSELLDPLDAVKAAHVVELFAEQRKRLVVSDARKAGKTWQEIGDALEISRQAAQQKFGYLG